MTRNYPQDLKLDNIVLGNFGLVYIADWGMAAYIGDDNDEIAALVGRPSAELAVGTPAYMAPE